MLNRLFFEIFCRIEWKKKNKHNFTRIGKNCNKVIYNMIKNRDITVGDYSYGSLNIDASGGAGESLHIGSFCSISNKCSFLLCGEHNVKSIMTFPFDEIFFKEKDKTKTKGKIIIEDDVWICDNAMITSGVHIGKGAVIAAGCVVVKDVPAYTIVGGIPNRIIRKRFSDNIINKLLEVDYNTVDINQVNKNYLYDDLTDENVDTVINALEKAKNI